MNDQEKFLDGFHIDVSHQEVERILSEIEEYYKVVREGGGEWVMLEGMSAFLAQDLGYEDVDEFEDALKGPFEAFLGQFPHIHIETRPDGKKVFRLVDPPAHQAKHTKMTVHVKEKSDLWRVCMKSENSRIVIPEIEFEIGSDSKRHIDTIYNHIGQAIFNLESFVTEDTRYTAEEKLNIFETTEKLRGLLDLENPWTLILDDPSGLSAFKPSEGVEVVELE
eukprot:c11510_g1_i1.p1 GENE.c11510_g1_i1~~c11510_g1_i1.p1  ORF type:complete len:236 (-),score=95.61 c11510_g1_i1:60-725(-)